MNRHAGPPRAPEGPPVPEPTYAERARTLAHLGRTATLATLSARHAGHPFASLMPYALDTRAGRCMLISTWPMHTQNLAAEPRASLLVAQPDWSGDPLAAARLTLMGRSAAADRRRAREAREAYLGRHDRARALGGLRRLRLLAPRHGHALLRRRVRGHGLDRRRGLPCGPAGSSRRRGPRHSGAHEPRPRLRAPHLRRRLRGCDGGGGHDGRRRSARVPAAPASG